MSANEVSSVFGFHADCIFVGGAKNAAIYDLTRRRIVSVPAPYYDAFCSFGQELTESALEALEGDGADARKFAAFVRYLLAEDLGFFGADADRFPAIGSGMEFPGLVQNAIIDVDRVMHDFGSLFLQLDRLGCEFVQIRVYSDLLGIEDLAMIGRAAAHTSIRGVELILRYDERFSDSALEAIVRAHLIFSWIVFHSALKNRVVEIPFGDSIGDGVSEVCKIHFVSTPIRSSDDCGRIDASTIFLPNAQVFSELRNYNGCLNGKIAVDAQGRIKNCPSFEHAFGDVGAVSLANVVASPDFRRLWGVAKDSIDVCRDCELRYACTDCRAHRADPDDLYSKPAKCGYDPYTGKWDLRVVDSNALTPGFTHEHGPR